MKHNTPLREGAPESGEPAVAQKAAAQKTEEVEARWKQKEEARRLRRLQQVRVQEQEELQRCYS